MKSALILIITIFLVSCAYSQKKEIPSGLLNRTWNKVITNPPATVTLFFRSDSTFVVTNPGHGVPPVLAYNADDSIITFPAAGCPGEGKYYYTINGDELNFKINDDSCTGRADVIVGIWTSVKTKEE